VENGATMCKAITCRLSQIKGSYFWRMGVAMPDMIRWISWGHNYFVRACDIVHFEFGTKRRCHLGQVDEAKVTKGFAAFYEHPTLLNDHLKGRAYLLS
jgi:glutathione S-transferase